MRIQEALIIVEDAQKVNNLERPMVRDEDAPIPEIWTPAHVSRRLVDAFKILHRTPRLRGPKGVGGSWPPHCYDWQDLEYQKEIGEVELDERREAASRSADRPTGREIAQMEKTLDWLRDMRKRDSSLAYVLMISSEALSRRRSLSATCKERNLGFRTFERRRRDGLKHLADWLNVMAPNVF
jgi:hypothetical protein